MMGSFHFTSCESRLANALELREERFSYKKAKPDAINIVSKRHQNHKPLPICGIIEHKHEVYTKNPKCQCFTLCVMLLTLEL
jgi:hypothetical protein